MRGLLRCEQCFDYRRVALNLAAANALIWLRHCKCFILAAAANTLDWHRRCKYFGLTLLLRILIGAVATNFIWHYCCKFFILGTAAARAYVLKWDFTQILFKMDLTF